jgi:hypothetical protein
MISHNSKAYKERIIENHLRYYETYKTGIKNCEQQLEYIMPSLVSRYEVSTDTGESFFIVNNTAKVALDRIESKRALDLKEEIERFKIIVSSIENAVEELTMQERAFVHLRYFECKAIAVVSSALGYAEEKSVYKVRRHVLDKLMISLKNLLFLK